MLPEAAIYMSVLYYGDNQQAFHVLEAAFPISFVLNELDKVQNQP